MLHIARDKKFYKTVAKLAVPLVLQSLVNSSLSMLDTFMVGALSEKALGGVTLANTVFFVVMLMNVGLQSGSSVLMSQYWGKRDTIAINRILGIGLFIAASVSLAVSVIVVVFPMQVYALTTNNADLVESAAGYARIVAFSWFINSITMMYLAAQRAMGNTRLGMQILIISMGLNTFLNWMMIFGKLGFPAMGIEGAALATLIARVVELTLTLCYAVFKSPFRLRLDVLLRPGMVMFKDFLHYSLPIVINETVWGFGFSLYAVIIGHMPNAVAGVAAYTITLNIERLLSAAYFGVGSAAAILVGHPLGAGDREAAQTAGNTILFITASLGLLTGIILAILSITVVEPFLFPLFNATEETHRVGRVMLLIVSLTSPFRAFNFCNIVGVLRGGGDGRAGAILDIGAMYLVALPLSSLAGLVFGASLVTVFALISVEELVKMIFGYWRFSQKQWLQDVTRNID